MLLCIEEKVSSYLNAKVKQVCFVFLMKFVKLNIYHFVRSPSVILEIKS